MISNLSSANAAPGSWNVGAYEVNACLPNGVLVDLNSDYVISAFTIGGNTFSVEFASVDPDEPPVTLVWTPILQISLTGSDLGGSASASGSGISGIRLLDYSTQAMEFEVDSEYINARLTAQSFLLT